MDSNEPLHYDASTNWARHCAECGQIDDSERWHTRDEAKAAGALDAEWTCPNCGSKRFELKTVARLGGG